MFSANDFSENLFLTKMHKNSKTNLQVTKESVIKLKNARVVQYNLVYIIGLSPRIASQTISSSNF